MAVTTETSQPDVPVGVLVSASFDKLNLYRVTVAWAANTDPLVGGFEVGVVIGGLLQTHVVSSNHYTFSAQPQQSYTVEVRATSLYGVNSAFSAGVPITPLGYLNQNVWSTNPALPAGEAALIDTHFYLSSNVDVAQAGIDPGAHFAAFGWQEGRNPDALFDIAYYLKNNPDIAAAHVDPLLQYVNFGWHEGRNPSAGFNTNAYLVANPDVKLAGINPLQHYLDFGAAEGRHLS